MSFIGLTKHIEIITINVIGQFNFGRNQFDLLDPDEIKLVKEAAGKISLMLSSYDAFRRIGDILKPISRNSSIAKNDSIVFIQKGIDIDDRNRLQVLVKEARLAQAGVDGRFPYILPSRDKIFR